MPCAAGLDAEGLTGGGELTHGFIGDSVFEHTIDMVGRRCKIENSCP